MQYKHIINIRDWFQCGFTSYALWVIEVDESSVHANVFDEFFVLFSSSGLSFGLLQWINYNSSAIKSTDSIAKPGIAFPRQLAQEPSHVIIHILFTCYRLMMSVCFMAMLKKYSNFAVRTLDNRIVTIETLSSLYGWFVSISGCAMQSLTGSRTWASTPYTAAHVD